MESLAKILFDFDKLPSKLVFIVAVLSGTILFAPATFLAKLKLADFTDSYGSWVGIAFVASLAFLAVTLLTTIQNRIRRARLHRETEKDIEQNLASLDPREKSILREFYIIGTTINLPMDNPQVVGLQDKHIIRLAQSNLGGSYFVSGTDMPPRSAPVSTPAPRT